jgi:hypothetical protein
MLLAEVRKGQAMKKSFYGAEVKKGQEGIRLEAEMFEDSCGKELAGLRATEEGLAQEYKDRGLKNFSKYYFAGYNQDVVGKPKPLGLVTVAIIDQGRLFKYRKMLYEVNGKLYVKGELI